MIFPWSHNLNHHFPWINFVKESIAKLLRPLIVTSLLITSGTLGLRYLGLMESAELAAYDQLIQQQPDAGADDRLLVVGITENDLQTLQEWPISDRTLSQTLTQLRQYQPQTIAIDIFRDFPHEPGTQELLTQLQQSPEALIICKASSVNDLGTPPPPDVSPEQVGFADLVVDPGGILRRSLLMAGPPEPESPFPKQHLCNQPNQTLLSLSFRAAMRYLGAQGIQAGFTEDQQLVLGTTVIPKIKPYTGGYERADTNGYQIMLYYRSERQAIPEVSLMEVINGQVDPELIRDRIVFIGYTTPQAKDDFYTPYSVGKDDNQKMPGVIVHAQSTSQLISTVLDGRPLIWVWSNAAEALWLLGWSLVGGILGWYSRHPLIFAGVIVLGIASLYSFCLLTLTQGGWIPLIPAALTFVGTAVGVVLLDRFSKSAYGQQVYRNVKNFLHLEIEIDEEKLEKQVSEITATDYFRDLQDKVKGIRKRSEQKAEKISSTTTWPHNQTAISWEDEPEDTDHVFENLDTLFHRDQHPQTKISALNKEQFPLRPLMQRGQSVEKEPATPTLKQDKVKESPTQDNTKLIQPHPQTLSSIVDLDSDVNVNPYELDLIQQLNQKAQQLKQNLVANSFQSDDSDNLNPLQKSDHQTTHTKQTEVTEVSLNPTPFSFDPAFCGHTDNSVATQEHIMYLASKIAALQAGIQVDNQED